MGADFLKRTRKTHSKSIDAGKVRLATPDLFTQTPKDQPRCAIAILTGEAVSTGEKLIIESEGKELVASKGNTVVARVKNPPADVITAISQSGGIAKGEIQKINAISKTVDISLC